MRELTKKEIKTLDKTSLKAEFLNRLYNTEIFLERLEDAGRIVGNGHHKAQRIVGFAEQEFEGAWKK